MSGIFDVKTLTMDQFHAVYNFLSFGLAAMLATTVFLYASQSRVLPRYRQAIAVSATVTLIAMYHYWRMFDSFEAAHGGGDPFNEAYRYVDWLLTVPLLLVFIDVRPANPLVHGTHPGRLLLDRCARPESGDRQPTNGSM